MAMYNQDYRAAREETVRSDISLMKMFKVTLKVKGENPPVLTAPNVGELYVRVGNPLGVSRVLMIFHKLEDGWKIVHAEEVLQVSRSAWSGLAVLAAFAILIIVVGSGANIETADAPVGASDD